MVLYFVMRWRRKRVHGYVLGVVHHLVLFATALLGSLKMNWHFFYAYHLVDVCYLMRAELKSIVRSLKPGFGFLARTGCILMLCLYLYALIAFRFFGTLFEVRCCCNLES